MALKGLRTRKLGFPLLVKELVEQSARRRTYIVRVVYAVLLFFAFAIYFYGEVAGRGESYQLLGIGGRMFLFLLVMQFIGIYVFLPAMVSGVITYEKERRSLELLFITDLGPWEIVLQKLGGRLVPMFTFLLLSLPLMAVCYSLGGVTAGSLALAAYVLFTTCFQVGAFAIMMSAYHRTSAEAMSATYGGGLALYFLVGIGTSIAMAIVAMSGSRGGVSFAIVMFVMASVSPPSLLTLRTAGFPGGMLPGTMLAPWIWTALFLFGARRFLVSRAFVPAKKTRTLLKRIDAWLTNRRMRARGAKRPRHGSEIPGDNPITWREVTRTSLGSPGYFVGTSLVFALPLLGVAALIVWLIPRSAEETVGFTIVICGLWVGAALSIATRSASTFALERANRTLEVLLITPLTGREIVAQKAAVVRRWILLFGVLLGALFVSEAYMEASLSYRRHRGTGELGTVGYLVTAFLSVAIYLSAVSWVARWIGLKVRGRRRATTITLAALFGWCVGPFILAGILGSLTRTYGGYEWLFVLSPGTIVVCAEIGGSERAFHHMVDMAPVVPIAINFAIHVVIILVFRALCLYGADRYLGRAVPGADGDSHHGDTETRRTA